MVAFLTDVSSTPKSSLLHLSQSQSKKKKLWELIYLGYAKLEGVVNELLSREFHFKQLFTQICHI